MRTFLIAGTIAGPSLEAMAGEMAFSPVDIPELCPGTFLTAFQSEDFLDPLPVDSDITWL